MKMINVACVVFPLTLAGLTAMAAGQDNEAQARIGEFDFTIGGGYDYGFDTDIDDGSEFSLSTANFNLMVRTDISETLNLSLNYDYSVDDYDFDGSTGIGGLEPWDDVHTQRIALYLHHSLAQDWTIFGGPVTIMSRESGASYSDSDVYGGAIGFSYNHSQDLTFGLGVMILDQIEESTLVLPIIILNWKLKPDLRLASTGSSARVGVELVYDLDETIELAAGLGYDFKRFRLDDDPVATDGVGQLTGLPIWGRATYKFDQNMSLSAIVGIRAAGELRVENSSGNKIAEEDFDPGWFVGASFRIRF